MDPIFRDYLAPSVASTQTPIGSRRFELARARLAQLAAREVEDVCDADVIEYFARGEQATRTYLEAGNFAGNFRPS